MSVSTVAAVNPPMTARAIGAQFSPLSPKPSDIGNIAMMVDSAVINTGRMRA